VIASNAIAVTVCVVEHTPNSLLVHGAVAIVVKTVADFDTGQHFIDALSGLAGEEAVCANAHPPGVLRSAVARLRQLKIRDVLTAGRGIALIDGTHLSVITIKRGPQGARSHRAHIIEGAQVTVITGPSVTIGVQAIYRTIAVFIGAVMARRLMKDDRLTPTSGHAHGVGAIRRFRNAKVNAASFVHSAGVVIIAAPPVTIGVRTIHETVEVTIEAIQAMGLFERATRRWREIHVDGGGNVDGHLGDDTRTTHCGSLSIGRLDQHVIGSGRQCAEVKQERDEGRAEILGHGLRGHVLRTHRGSHTLRRAHERLLRDRDGQLSLDTKSSCPTRGVCLMTGPDTQERERRCTNAPAHRVLIQ